MNARLAAAGVVILSCAASAFAAGIVLSASRFADAAAGWFLTAA